MKKLIWANLVCYSLLITSCTENNNNTSTNTTVQTTTTATTPDIKTALAPSLADLKDDPNILWVAEKMVDYAPNYYKWTAQVDERKLMESAGFKSRNEFKILKHQVADLNNSNNDDHNLVYKIIRNIDAFTCYKNPELTETYTTTEAKEQISSVDTLMLFDPATQQEVKQVIVNELDPYDVKFFRVKEIIYYDKKAMLFRTIPIALAPMIVEVNPKGEYLNSTPLFWIKPNFMTSTPSLNNENITWAKRLYRNCPLGDATIQKAGKTLEQTMDILMADLRANANDVYLGHVFDHDGNKSLTAEEIKVLGSSIDTIITFDPKDFKEIVQVVHNKVAGKDIQGIRLMQDWVWDEKNKQLNICYVGFKPIINRYDAQGNFLNSGPMFTRKVTDLNKSNL